MKKIFYSFLILSMIISCNKEPVQVYQGDPVFKINGSIGGDAVSIDAGVNGYMESYHDTLFGKSYVGCVFNNETSASPIRFDLALDGLLGDVLINGGFSDIDFGELSNIYPLLIEDVTNYDLLNYGEWTINGIPYAENTFIEGDGVYDIEFNFQSYGEDYVLRDKLFVGGDEQFEPEIEIIPNQSGAYTFIANNVPGHVDSVEWILGSGFELEYASSSQAQFNLLQERYVIQCNYYSNGELVNYKSEMFGFNSGIENISIDELVNSIEDDSEDQGSKAEMMIVKDNMHYYSIDNSPGEFEMSNIELFTDPVTSLELVKGDFNLAIVLYASPVDSIVVNLNGTIGLKANP